MTAGSAFSERESDRAKAEEVTVIDSLAWPAGHARCLMASEAIPS